MSLSVQCSVIEPFSFNGKNIRAVHVPDVGQCLVAKDVYTAVGYNKKMGSKPCSYLFQESTNLTEGKRALPETALDVNI